VLHEYTVLLTLVIEEIPHVPRERRVTSSYVCEGIFRLILSYGFMDETDVPQTLANLTQQELGFFYEPMKISYFLSRETIIAADNPAMGPLRESLFAWMARSSASTMEFLSLPAPRVVELGDQIEI
jgi:KUP system potassium uptake protein